MRQAFWRVSGLIRDREFDLEQEQRPGAGETRLQLVLAVLAHEMTVAEAARRHGVSEYVDLVPSPTSRP